MAKKSLRRDIHRPAADFCWDRSGEPGSRPPDVRCGPSLALVSLGFFSLSPSGLRSKTHAGGSAPGSPSLIEREAEGSVVWVYVWGIGLPRSDGEVLFWVASGVWARHYPAAVVLARRMCCGVSVFAGFAQVLFPRMPSQPTPTRCRLRFQPLASELVVWLCVVIVGLLALPAAAQTLDATPATESLLETVVPDDIEEGGVFLPSRDAVRLWEETLATVSASHVVARIDPPDFASVPPRAGVIESSWTEPGLGRSAVSGWPPQRQRVVVRVVPGAGGAWVEGIVETQVLSGPPPDSQTAANSLPLDVVSGIAPVGHWEAVTHSQVGPDPSDQFTASLVARMAPAEVVAPLPDLDDYWQRPRTVPWADSRFPRLARVGYKVLEDYRNFYDCQSLVCTTAAFGAGALMANTGFDQTLQTAWQQSVTPSDLGTFFSDCKDIGEGRYSIPIFAVAATTGLFLEGRPLGDAIGGWGARSLRIIAVGAPPLYVLQMATGASRPDESSAGSKWVFFNDNNGVSGHSFMGAVPFLAAATMVEDPVAKGSLYVCSTFVGLSRMTDNAHYPSQSFLGWYLAFASAMAVNDTEMHFVGMQVNVMPIPLYGGGSGMGFETRW